jgi:hypothetical protein
MYQTVLLLFFQQILAVKDASILCYCLLVAQAYKKKDLLMNFIDFIAVVTDYCLALWEVYLIFSCVFFYLTVHIFVVIDEILPHLESLVQQLSNFVVILP